MTRVVVTGGSGKLGRAVLRLSLIHILRAHET
jgi:uncharacterized protein YbjT (DUF2867 family)